MHFRPGRGGATVGWKGFGKGRFAVAEAHPVLRELVQSHSRYACSCRAPQLPVPLVLAMVRVVLKYVAYFFLLSRVCSPRDVWRRPPPSLALLRLLSRSFYSQLCASLPPPS